MASCVVSVEHVTITLGDSDTIVTQALSKGQTLAQCVPMFITREHNEDSATSDGHADHSAVRVRVYDNGGTPTVECRRYAAGNNSSIIVSVHVVEFIDDITVRSGLQTVSDGGTYTIGGHTDSAYTFLSCSYYFTGASGNGDDVSYEVGLTATADRIVLNRYANGNGTAYFAWYTVEDDTAGDHFNCQHVSASVGGFSSSASATITAVTMDKTFVFGGAWSQYESYGGAESSWDYYLSTSTVVRASKSSAGANRTAGVRWCVVELENVDAKVLRGDETIASGVESGNVSLGQTFSENSAVGACYHGHWAGQGMSSIANRYASSQCRMEIDSGRDGIDWSRNSNAATGTGMRWEAVDFGKDFNRRIYIT